jgi:hypothetical protein
MRLPGDEFITAPTVQTDHAITIEAPASSVWPWLVQMGWGRAGWYTARWVDQLFFPANGPSADRIVPDLQDIEVGTFIPDGPPETECGLHVVELVPERALVLRSNSHLPMSWRDRATLDWTWTFILTPEVDGRRTRFHFRARWVTEPWWTAVGWLGVVPADFVMSRDMLRGVKARAEPATAAEAMALPPTMSEERHASAVKALRTACAAGEPLSGIPGDTRSLPDRGRRTQAEGPRRVHQAGTTTTGPIA